MGYVIVCVCVGVCVCVWVFVCVCVGLCVCVCVLSSFKFLNTQTINDPMHVHISCKNTPHHFEDTVCQRDEIIR